MTSPGLEDPLSVAYIPFVSFISAIAYVLKQKANGIFFLKATCQLFLFNCQSVKSDTSKPYFHILKVNTIFLLQMKLKSKNLSNHPKIVQKSGQAYCLGHECIVHYSLCPSAF